MSCAKAIDRKSSNNALARTSHQYVHEYRIEPHVLGSGSYRQVSFRSLMNLFNFDCVGLMGIAVNISLYYAHYIYIFECVCQTIIQMSIILIK
jgi:hypothetical protein